MCIGGTLEGDAAFCLFVVVKMKKPPYAKMEAD
jgi:hypothetical protein